MSRSGAVLMRGCECSVTFVRKWSPIGVILPRPGRWLKASQSYWYWRGREADRPRCGWSGGGRSGESIGENEGVERGVMLEMQIKQSSVRVRVDAGIVVPSHAAQAVARLVDSFPAQDI